MQFPSAPTDGQVYSFQGREWRWSGSAWDRVINAGQIVSVMIETDTLVEETVEAMPQLVTAAFTVINYV